MSSSSLAERNLTKRNIYKHVKRKETENWYQDTANCDDFNVRTRDLPFSQHDFYFLCIHVKSQCFLKS